MGNPIGVPGLVTMLLWTLGVGILHVMDIYK